MEELIWFSIPGAVFTIALVTIFPSLIESDAKSVVLALSVPVTGFIIHELFRLLFELTGGFARKSRKVIDFLMQEIAPTENIKLSSRESAFMVWEITFYSDGIPSSFLNHDRGAWHYLLSFWGISMTAFIAACFCLIAYFVVRQGTIPIWVALFEALVGVTFYWKGLTTYRSLVEQEIAIVKMHKELFVKTLKALHK